MSREEILEKAIEKAVKNGYSFRDVFQEDRFKLLKKGIREEKKGYSELFKKAIYLMIPSNKLRTELMKLLSVTE